MDVDTLEMVLRKLATTEICEVDITHTLIWTSVRSRLLEARSKTVATGGTCSDIANSFRLIGYGAVRSSPSLCLKTPCILEILFQASEDMHGIVEKVPWNINNGLLVILEGDIHTVPPLEAFNWVVTSLGVPNSLPMLQTSWPGTFFNSRRF